MSGLKSGMDAVQVAVDKLGARVTEAETQISTLEDKSHNLDAIVGTSAKTIAQLQEKVTYLEDAGHAITSVLLGWRKAQRIET